MRTINMPAYAKINLFLDVTGLSCGYHMLDTVVTTVDICDRVIVTARSDGEVRGYVKKGIFRSPIGDDDNAVRAAKLFFETFGGGGADITVDKRIPVGGGLGGSSTDISATLKALAKIFDVTDDLKPLADKIGSDSGYLLTGGYARLFGRGEKVTSLDVQKKLHLVIITAEGGVSTPKCFSVFDEAPCAASHSYAESLITALYADIHEKLPCYNALYEAANKINPKVGEAKKALEELSPLGCGMSGSGSSVFAAFETKELCDWAASRLKRKFRKVFCVSSVSREQISREEESAFRYSSI